MALDAKGIRETQSGKTVAFSSTVTCRQTKSLRPLANCFKLARRVAAHYLGFQVRAYNRVATQEKNNA